MRIIRFALARPYTIMVLVFAVAIAASFAVKRMHIDIFPSVGDPIIYLGQPYAGMDPQQMESFITYFYEYHFLYIPRLKYIDAKHIQGSILMKLAFEPGTDMAEALSYVIAFANRSRGLMPPSVQPAFILRFDPGSLPIGTLVLSSKTRTVGEMQDFALNNVRPLYTAVPGVAGPPPWGGNQRTIILRVDPERMRAYNLSFEDVIQATNRATQIIPSGTARIQDTAYLVQTNSILSENVQELLKTPIRTGSGPTVFLRDIGTVNDSFDYVTSYAHINGKRTVFLPIIKRYDSSTLAAVQGIKAALPGMNASVPEDVKVTFEFDQSIFVSNAIKNLFHEGLLAALLAGIMVLVFLRDWRSTIVVIVTIPSALMAALVGLWVSGQTINLMTLGGLALAVSMLVDEATVYIENVHAQLAAGRSRALAVAEAGRATSVPRLLAMLCVLAVFLPSIFMTGIAQQLFIPLSLAVGFSMLSSYVLSNTLVPVLSVWLLREVHGETRGGLLATLKQHYQNYLERVLNARAITLGAYALVAVAVLALVTPTIGTEIFPQTDGKEFELLIRAPTGTRVERTEEITLKVFDLIKQEVGAENVVVETDFVGVNPPNYPINIIFIWTSGPHEAVMQVRLSDDTPLKGEELRERLRQIFKKELPHVAISFQAGDIVSKVMSFGSSTPIEVAVAGKNLLQVREHAEKIRAEMETIPELRDIQWAQPQDYPTLDVTVDRDRAGQLGLTERDVARSVSMSTLSSRWQEINFWRDPKNGQGYQLQVEVPQHLINSAEDLESLPVTTNGGESRTLLGDVAKISYGSMPGLIERLNSRRVISITANISGKTVGEVTKDVEAAIQRAGEPPRGMVVEQRGEIPPLQGTLAGLKGGLMLAIGSIFLLITAYFQSLRIAIAVIATAPAVLIGVVLALWLTGTTLNVQSYMGAIMAIGIAIANSILLLNFAEKARLEGADVTEAVMTGSLGRLRPILMTAGAMIAGMMPMALGLGEGGTLAAPLGRAVVGGLIFATLATLTLLPVLYSVLMSKQSAADASVDPYDPRSRYYEPAARSTGD